MLKYFYAAGSCSLAPHILLVDAGLDFETVRIDSADPDPWTEEYTKLNPNKQVPFIQVEPGVVIAENVAVQTLISQLAPNKKYLGETDLEVVRTYQWLSYMTGALHSKAYGPYFRPGRFSDDESALAGIKARAGEKIEECYQYIESRVGERKPIDHVLAVDAYLFVFFRWGQLHDFGMKEKFPKYYARMAQFAQLESVKKTLAAEDINSTLE